jgi:hypothetical protein
MTADAGRVVLLEAIQSAPDTMTQDAAGLVVAYLHQLGVKLDGLREDMIDVKRRLTSVEASVSRLHGDFVGQSVRIDRIEGWLDRIERRL